MFLVLNFESVWISPKVSIMRGTTTTTDESRDRKWSNRGNVDKRARVCHEWWTHMFCDLLKHSSGHWIPKVSWSFINTIHTDTAYSRGITRSQNLLLFSSPRMLWTYGSCDKSLLLCTLTWRSSGFLEREIPNPVPEKRKTHLNGAWIINTLSEQQLSGWSIGTHVVYVVQLQYWRSRVDNNILNGRRDTVAVWPGILIELQATRLILLTHLIDLTEVVKI